MGRRQAVTCKVFSICGQSAQSLAAAVSAGTHNVRRALRLYSNRSAFAMIQVVSMRIDTRMRHTAVDKRGGNYR
jgi:hypothetical protein